MESRSMRTTTTRRQPSRYADFIDIDDIHIYTETASTRSRIRGSSDMNHRQSRNVRQRISRDEIQTFQPLVRPTIDVGESQNVEDVNRIINNNYVGLNMDNLIYPAPTQFAISTENGYRRVRRIC